MRFTVQWNPKAAKDAISRRMMMESTSRSISVSQSVPYWMVFVRIQTDRSDLVVLIGDSRPGLVLVILVCLILVGLIGKVLKYLHQR